MVGEVGLADDMEAGDRAHQVVVHPEPAHRVVHRGIDPHGNLVRILVGNPVIHLEEIAVTIADGPLPQPPDRIGKVEIDAKPALPDPASLVTHFLGSP
jgi:hypothetical protein